MSMLIEESWKSKESEVALLLIRALISEGKLVRVSFVPTQRNAQNNVEILDASGDGGRDTVDRVVALSEEFETDFSVEGQEVVIGLEQQ